MNSIQRSSVKIFAMAVGSSRGIVSWAEDAEDSVEVWRRDSIFCVIIGTRISRHCSMD